jgi:GT2 family glycosyltransferase
MNPVLILTHNNLELTKRAVASAQRQDIVTRVFVLDNGSTDATREWGIKSLQQDFNYCETNLGVSKGWNAGLSLLFGFYEAQHVFVVGNDTWLPSSFCRSALSIDLPFVTGVAVDNMAQAEQPATIMPLEPRPDFSAYCISRECWEKVGPFDERFVHYCGDCDMHIRAHRLGVPMFKANIPFFHERSSTIRLASPEERAEIEAQANKDRAVFQSMYGCLPGSKEYEEIFK